jgi:aspartyl-tRNA(Asn)/glutamyl-tRNA(Gln) amidotransferase subunit A
MSGLPTSKAIVARYRDGSITPSSLVKTIADAARSMRGKPNRDPFVALDVERALRDAEESEKRWKANTPRSELEGVPIAVKDHVDVEGYATRNGARWTPDAKKIADAPYIAQLRAAGAVVVGKLHQHELGLGATGINPHFPAPRNPHDIERAPGGSSSGSGAAVAAGLVPIAIGADGGGSIRIPSSLNGVFGIKPTFGRVSRTAADLDGGTLAVAGPLASSVADLDLALRHGSAIDPRDRSMDHAPPLDLAALDRAKRMEPRKIRLGIVSGELSDADPDVAAAFERALTSKEIQDVFERVDVSIPTMHLARTVGYVTFGVEVAAGHRSDLNKHRESMGLDVRLLLALGERITGDRFLHSQRHRARLRRDVDAALRKVDLLVLPSTACTAPKIHPEAERGGEVDDAVTSKLARYTFMANLCGLPASSSPIGVDRSGLPIGLQFVGAAFDEPTVLHAMYVLERAGIAACPPAKNKVQIL